MTTLEKYQGFPSDLIGRMQAEVLRLTADIDDAVGHECNSSVDVAMVAVFNAAQALVDSLHNLRATLANHSQT